MPAIDAVSNRNFVRKPKKRKRIVARQTPDQADRSRSSAQRARDRRASRSAISDAKTRARVTPDQADRNRAPAVKRHDAEAVAKAVRDSRRAYVNKRDRGSGFRDIKKTLQGKEDTNLIGALRSLGNQAAKRNQEAAGIHREQASFLPMDKLGNPDDLASRTFKDIANVPAEFIPSASQTIHAGWRATKGDFKPLKEMAKAIDEGDAVYNTAAAGVQAVRGNKKAASERLKAAKKSASEHPGIALMEVVGGRGAAGRGLGAGVRTAGAVTGSKTLKRIGSTESREPRVLADTHVRDRRAYSKDLFRKAGQVINENRKAKHARELTEQAAKEKDPEKRKELLQRAREADPYKIRDRDIHRRVDEHMDQAEQVRRAHQQAVKKVENRAVKKARKGGPIASLLAQRIARADADDLEAYLQELKTIHPTIRHRSKRVANEQLTHDLEKALKKVRRGKVSVQEMKQIADDFVDRSIDAQEKLYKRKIVAQPRGERSALIPFATRALGAKRDPELLARRHAEAAAVEKKAGSKAKRKRKKYATLRGRDQRAVLVGGREEFVTGAAARSGPEPTVASLTRNVKDTGEPGRISVEDKHVAHRDPTTQKTVGWGPALRGTKAVVKRDKNGKPIGVLDILFDNNGKVDKVTVAVDPAHRGKGVGASLYTAARKAGIDVDSATGRHGYTEAGAHLAFKRLEAAETKRKKNVKAAKTNARITREEHVAAQRQTANARERMDQNPLLDREGNELPTKAMLEALREVEGDGARAAYITQRPPGPKGGFHWVSGVRPPSAGEKKRSGEATRMGTFDAKPEMLAHQAARTQGLADAFDAFEQLVTEFGRRKPDGKLVHLKDKATVDDEIEKLNADSDTEWMAIRINPFGGSEDQLSKLMEGVDTDSGAVAKIEEAFRELGDQGPWAIIPKAAAGRVKEHMDALSPGNTGRVARNLNSAFRKAVLATSIPWMLGNITEASFRAAVNQAGPRSWLTAHKTLKALEKSNPAQHERIQARTIGGGHYAYANRTIHDNLEGYSNNRIKTVVRGAQKVRNAPIARIAPNIWDRYNHVVFQNVNKTIEQQFQKALLGKAMREQLMPDKARKLSSQVFRDIAENKLQGPEAVNHAVALGREVDRMYGRYSKFSPDKRKAIALYTPFVAWMLNAGEMLARMPFDHPTFTALAAAQHQAQEEWLKDHKLDHFIKGRVPFFLQGSIPAGKGGLAGWLNEGGGGNFRAPTRYTPFSLATDPLGTVAGSVLPQINGVLSAFQGRDWKGNKLKGADGGEANIAEEGEAAFDSFIKSMIPFYALGSRVKEKGPKQALIGSALGYSPPGKKKTPATGGVPGLSLGVDLGL